MFNTLADKALQTYLLAVPAPGSTALPGTGDSKMSIIEGWILGGVGIAAVVGLFAAAISFMLAKHNQQSTDGPGKAIGILAAVVMADVAVAAVTALL